MCVCFQQLGCCSPTSSAGALQPCPVFASADKATGQSFFLKDSKQLVISEAKLATTEKSVLLASILEPVPTLQDHTNLHALEHFSHSEDLSSRVFNYSLILLSLERFSLPDASASTSGQLQSTSSSLLLDHPFDVPLSLHSSEERALVPAQGIQEAQVGVDSKRDFQLAVVSLPTAIRDLSSYTVLEMLSRHSVVQLLQDLQTTHPYIEVYHHKHSQSVVLVAHAGFKGDLMYKRQWKAQAHSKVGFGNYLQYVAESYGSTVDDVVARDAERKEDYELNRKMLEEKVKESLRKSEQQEDEAKGVKPSGSSAASVKKTPVGKTTTAKASKLPSKEASATPSTTNLEAIPEFEDRKIFAAYDIGDTVLLNTGSVTTQFTADGVQIRTERQRFVEGNESVNVLVISAGNTVTATTVTGETPTQPDKPSAEDTQKEESDNADCLPKPHPPVIFSSLQASIADSIRVSVSHYGPGGDGVLPHLPAKPAILEDASSLDSRPQSNLAPSPQKGSKKQQEQQQLLEQQRLLEEKRLQAIETANVKYQQQLRDLAQVNKHQQLFASTVFGLQVHFQIVDSVEGESDANILVKQCYPIHSKGIQETDQHLLKAAFNEKQRCCTPDGSIIRFMKDDSIIIYTADGGVCRTASASETECLESIEERGTQPLTQVESGTKVTFEDLSPELSRLELLQDKVWVITKPTGKQYLWKKQKAPDNNGEDGVEQEATKDETASNEEAVEESPPEPARRSAPLPPVVLFPTTDPVTKEVLITRDDGVTVLKRPNNTVIAEFPDGSRVTSSFDDDTHNRCRKVTIECPGFARVTFNRQTNCFVSFPDGAEIHCSNQGCYAVKKDKYFSFEITSEGEAVFKAPSKAAAIKGSEVCTLNKRGTPEILNATDSAGNKFTVDLKGERTVAASPNSSIPMDEAFKPRYFVIQQDETAYELLEADYVEHALTAARQDSRAAVIEDGVTGESQVKATTLVQPVDVQTRCHALPYLEDSIVPVNLRLGSVVTESKKETQQNGKTVKKKFGVSTGRGLTIGRNEKVPSQPKPVHPDALAFRQFIKVGHSYNSLKDKVLEKVSSFRQWSQQQEQQNDHLQLTDERSDTEKECAEALKMNFQSIDKSKMHHSYVRLCLTPKEEPPARTPELSQLGSEFIEEATKELEEAELIKEALRQKQILPYFKSEEGRQYLCTNPPDMSSLAARLAQPKPTIENPASSCSTPSTLQSTSLLLPLVDADSPTQSELGPVRSLSKIRPAHPTPDHAQGGSTPTELRPTNPTPSQALNVSGNEDDALSLSAASNKLLLLSSAGNTESTDISIAQPASAIPGAGWDDVFSEEKASQALEATSRYLDVTGSPRKVPVKSPASVLGGKPGELDNTKV